ncbi:MAG: hypothetical protein ACI865_001937 [Flavobacteriaceae bacterium]
MPFLFVSCDVSMNKDFVTGMKTTGSGISVENVYLEINDEKVKRTEYQYGEKVLIKCNGISGFERKNGRSLVGLFVKIINSKSKEVVNLNEDLFKDKLEGFSEKSLLITTHFNAAFSYQDNEEYLIMVHIWDKNGTGTFDIEMPFTIVENKLLNIQPKGIDYSAVYLWDQQNTRVITDNIVSLEEGVKLLIDGAEGLEVVDNLVYPGLSIELLDNNGAEIFRDENLLLENSTNGLDPTLAMEQLPVSLTLEQKKVSNPAKLKLVYFDMNSDKKLIIETELTIK